MIDGIGKDGTEVNHVGRKVAVLPPADIREEKQGARWTIRKLLKGFWGI